MFKKVKNLKTEYSGPSHSISNMYEVAFGYLFYRARGERHPLSGYRSVKRSDSYLGIKIIANKKSQIKLRDKSMINSRLSLSDYTTKYYKSNM